MPLNKIEDDVMTMQITDEYIFPALQKYKNEHNILNLQKLCVEVAEFCRSIFASTRDEEEREVYKKMLDKLIKQ